MSRRLQIAIDGPASSGKGTVARLVAQQLGYAYVDTGAMYRSLALFAQRQGVSWGDESALVALCQTLSFAYQWDGDRLLVLVNQEDVTAVIRGPEIGQGASQVSVHAGVRTALLDIQRALAADGGVVMEGRDIGTVVLPKAGLKIFLDADVVIRGKRRAEELRQKGERVDTEHIIAELRIRDHRDRSRPLAPLKQAKDAVYLDTSNMTPGHAAREIVRMARGES